MKFPTIRSKANGYLVFLDGKQFGSMVHTQSELKMRKRRMSALWPNSEIKVLSVHGYVSNSLGVRR